GRELVLRLPGPGLNGRLPTTSQGPSTTGLTGRSKREPRTPGTLAVFGSHRLSEAAGWPSSVRTTEASFRPPSGSVRRRQNEVTTTPWPVSWLPSVGASEIPDSN